MTVEKIILSLKSEIRIIIISILSFLLLSSIITFFLIKPRYEGNTKVFVGKERFVNTSDNYTNEEVIMYQMMIKTYTELLKTRDLAKRIINETGAEVSVEKVLGSIKITPLQDTQILDITYTSNSKKESYIFIYEITKKFVQDSKKLYPNVNVQVLEQPKIPEDKVSPNNFINIFIGGFLGLAFGVVLVLWREFFNNTIRSKEDMELLLELPTIAVIPKYNE